jgi:hypothetical protein
MYGFLVGFGVFWLLFYVGIWVMSHLANDKRVQGLALLGTFGSSIYLVAVGVGGMINGACV